jgi:hypothetical protein
VHLQALAISFIWNSFFQLRCSMFLQFTIGFSPLTPKLCALAVHCVQYAMSNSQFCEITLVLNSRFWRGFDSRFYVSFVEILIQNFVAMLQKSCDFYIWCSFLHFLFAKLKFFVSRTFQFICHFFVLILCNLTIFCTPSWWGHCNLCCWFISYKFYYKFGNIWSCVMKFNLMKNFNFTIQKTKLSFKPCWTPWSLIHINCLLLLICCLIRILGIKWNKVYNMVSPIFDKSI